MAPIDINELATILEPLLTRSLAPLVERMHAIELDNARRNGAIQRADIGLGEVKALIEKLPCGDHTEAMTELRLEAERLKAAGAGTAKEQTRDEKRWEKVNEILIEIGKFIVFAGLGALIARVLP